MPVEDAADVLAMFGLADFAEAATYAPPGAAPRTVPAILRRAEAGVGPGSGMVATGWTALVPAAALPGRPVTGATLTLGAGRFAVEGCEVDTAGAVWTLTLRRAG